MICEAKRTKILKSRLWKLSKCGETKKKIILHGIFVLEFLWIVCRPSVLYLWIKSHRIIGKGVFSRSEPLFLIPNPCYNSLGKVGRERRILKKAKIFHPCSEYLQVNFLELKHTSKKGIFTQFEPVFKLIEDIIFKIDIEFFFNFLTFGSVLGKSLELKSGVKFSGNFLIYKKTKTYNFHDHSRCVLSTENSNYKKLSCVYCDNSNFQLFDIQNRIRLSTQVSKFNVFFFGGCYYKTSGFGKYKVFTKTELNLNRFFI